jgi:hypothetical protein
MRRREQWLDEKMGIENQGVDRVPRRGQEATFHHQFLLRVVVYDLLRRQTTISLLDYPNRRLWQPLRDDVKQDTLQFRPCSPTHGISPTHILRQ